MTLRDDVVAAIEAVQGTFDYDDYSQHFAGSDLAEWQQKMIADAIIPLVQDAERERCARVAYLRKDCATGEMFIATANDLPSGRPSGSVDATPDEKAAAIRNLKDE